MIAVAGGGAADLDKPTGTDSDISGIGVAPAMVVGLNVNNLGVEDFSGLDTRRLNVYANYMQYGRAESLNPWIGMDSEASVDMKTLGVRMNYAWIESKEYRHFSWGGP